MHCDPADRLACDAAEFEGVRPPPRGGGNGGGGGGSWQPSRAEIALAWAFVPVLLLGLVSRMHRRRNTPKPAGGSGIAGLHGRRFASLGPQAPPSSSRHAPDAAAAPVSWQQQQEQQQFVASLPPVLRPAREQLPTVPPPLPPHPATAVDTAGGGGGASQPGGASERDPAASAAALLAAADGAITHLLVRPISLLQHAKYLALGRASGGGGGAAGPDTPEGPPGAAASPARQQQQQQQQAGGGSGSGVRASGARYGLGIGEAESDEDEWASEGGESELTQAAVRRLQQSPEFKAYLKARGLHATDLARSTRRLRLYRRLRRLDPSGFWQLLRPGSRTVFLSRAPSRLLLACDYLLSTAANLAVAAAASRLYWVLAALPTPTSAAAAAAVVWMAAAAQWLEARPTAGGLYGLWYEEPRWGHAAPAWRCVAANLLELLYVVLSAGIGAVVSLCLRSLSGRRQGVGELLAGVHAVQEVRLAAPVDGEDHQHGN